MVPQAATLPTINNRYPFIARFVSLVWLARTNSYTFKDDAIDAIPVAFVDTFFGTGGMPVLNLANVAITLSPLILY